MKAVVCMEPGQLGIFDRDEPKPGDGEVLVRIRRVGVCGTDYHILHGNQPYLSYPRLIGHELAGEVAEAPKGSALRAGDRVSIEPYLYCGACIACRQGKTNCCRTLEVLGVHRDGGLCEYVSVPESNVVPAHGLTIDQAAMVEFLAIGAHGIRRSGVQPGERVLIAGAGPIGVAAALFAKEAGAEVSILDINDRRLSFCSEAIGVDRTFRVAPEIDKQLADATKGEFFHVVIDATGSPGAMQKGFGYVAHGGTYVLLSIVRAAIAFDDPEFHKRETSLLGSRNATRSDFEHVMAAIREGAIPTTALVTHRGTIADAADLIPVWSRAESAVIKALVEV